MRPTYPTHHIHLDFISSVISGEKYKQWIPSVCSFLQPLLTSSLFGSTFLLRTPSQMHLILVSFFFKLRARFDTYVKQRVNLEFCILWSLCFTEKMIRQWILNLRHSKLSLNLFCSSFCRECCFGFLPLFANISLRDVFRGLISNVYAMAFWVPSKYFNYFAVLQSSDIY